MKYCHVISNGEELAVRETVICDVYRVSRRDQGLIQGNVILDLLHHTAYNAGAYTIKAVR